MINLNKSPLGCSEVAIIIRGCGTSETAAMATLRLMEMRLAVKWEGIRPLNAVPFHSPHIFLDRAAQTAQDIQSGSHT